MPFLDFSQKANRDWIAGTLMSVRSQLPFRVPVVVNGKEVSGLETRQVTNPSLSKEVVSINAMATRKEADEALSACESAKQTWGKWPVGKRVHVLRKAADLMEKYREELTTIMVLEEAKSWKESDADVCEAIDFCRYYADEAERYFVPRPTSDLPGESNFYTYFPRGTCLTISPWNFPCAILCGMTVAPLVCGNPVIMKPSNQAPGIGYRLFQILIEAGVPNEALHFLTGSGATVGDYLTKHPAIHVIAFTGSREVGLNIIKEASVIHPGQRHIKKVIAEMGGKNAIIIDDDADLDLAVTHCLHAAFGFSGQKCSALSRLIVLDNIYDKFKTRYLEGMKSLTVGAAHETNISLGPVIDKPSRDRLMAVIERNRKNIIGQLELTASLMEQGNFVPPTIFEATDFQSELGQVEFFGPLVTLFRVKNIDEAIKSANDVDYALTGGLFSRSPANIERIKHEMECGNLYINRANTGALVGRQPFGGFKLSGIHGSKAGGPDYLLHFLEPKTITENTMRRGFAPEA